MPVYYFSLVLSSCTFQSPGQSLGLHTDSWNPWIIMWTPWTCNKNKQTLEKDKWTPWTVYGIHGLIKDLTKLQERRNRLRVHGFSPWIPWGIHGFTDFGIEHKILIQSMEWGWSPWIPDRINTSELYKSIYIFNEWSKLQVYNEYSI